MTLSFRIRQRAVDFQYFQRLRIRFVLDAQDELLPAIPVIHSRHLRLSFMPLRPIPWASYQCTSAPQIVPSANRTCVMPLRFRQFPRPLRRWICFRLRIDEPCAIVSTCSIFPTISKAGILVVVLQPQVGDEIFAAHPAQGVFELHQLNENIVLGIQAGRDHRRLEVKR